MKPVVPLLLMLIAPMLGAQTAIAFADLDALVAHALRQDTALAAAAARLVAARSAVGAEKPWRSSSLSLQSSLGAPLPEGTSENFSGSYGASLSVPLAYWLSLGAAVSGTEGKSGNEAPEGRVSLSVTPFTLPLDGAILSYRSALNAYNGLLRSTYLDLRSTVRALVVVRAESAYRELELELAQGTYDGVLIKSERGEAGDIDLLSALAERIAAEVAVDSLRSQESALRADLALRLGIPVELLPETAALGSLDLAETPSDGVGRGVPMDRDAWLAASTTYVQALLEAESAQRDARRAQVRPNLALSGEAKVALSGLNQGTGSWSVSAVLKLPIDVVYRDAAATAEDLAGVKKREAELARTMALNGYDRKLQDLTRYEATWRRAETSAKAAGLLLEQVVLLHSLNRRSENDLRRAKAETLKAQWQTAVALKSYRDALDALRRYDR